MVLTHPVYCPTKLIEGHSFEEALPEVLAERNWALITSEGWVRRGVLEKLGRATRPPAEVISDVDPNPTFSSIPRLESQLPDVEAVVALGGGSVIDACKAALALRGCQPLGEGSLGNHLREGTALLEEMKPLPLIAIPTTSGTGSEVTRWGTIWGDDGIKHSVTDPRLFPTHAILDPGLLVSMSDALALATGLDALSHAMEAVWNRRHTAVTDAIAISAIAMIKEHLGPSIAEPDNIERRRYLQTASVMAGLAMGTTQTALAHSISYPFTAHFGVPHGLACSFTLAEVARYNLEEDVVRLQPIADGLNCVADEIPEALEVWFDQLGLGQELSAYVEPSVTDQLGDNLITRARAANNIRDIDGAMARQLARSALERFIPPQLVTAKV